MDFLYLGFISALLVFIVPPETYGPVMGSRHVIQRYIVETGKSVQEGQVKSYVYDGLSAVSKGSPL